VGVSAERLGHLRLLYALIDDLALFSGGPRRLSDCTGRMAWPSRGVYFFLEPGEIRSDTGSGLRIVRVGTHALKAGAQTSFWNRLAQHRGNMGSGDGNHRGSIFRLLVGAALICERGLDYPDWGQGSSATKQVRDSERPLERQVSERIGRMQVVGLKIDDESGPKSLRGFIERNAIALLSNAERQPIDPPSRGWLGHACPRERVRASGLWNQNHVDESYEPVFLDSLKELIKKERFR